MRHKLPKGIILSDYHTWAILKGQLANKKKVEAFPADFTVKRKILKGRENRGRAAKYRDKNEVWKYRDEDNYVFLGNGVAFTKGKNKSLVIDRKTLVAIYDKCNEC